MKITRVLNWLLWNGISITALYYWLFEGNAFARNVAVVLIWMHFIVSFAAFIPEVKEELQKKGPSVQAQSNWILDFGISMLLIGTGHPWYGLMYLIGGLIQMSVYEEDENEHHNP